MNVVESTSLYFKDGSSDKEYHASVKEVEGGYLVSFSYGRRGSTLTSGTKTVSPVDLPTAKKIYTKLVNEKLAKGYTASGTGKIFTEQEERQTGIIPQLLNPITEEEAEKYLDNPLWCIQEKFDGKRIMVSVKSGVVTGSNRKGLSVSLPQELSDSLGTLSDCELDGELIGDKYYIFDILKIDGVDIRGNSYIDRVSEVLPELCYVAPYRLDTKVKRNFYETMKSQNAEGVVFKRLDAPYTPGRPASGGTQLKCKFYATTTCKVSDVNNQRSIKLSMRGVSVGNVTIPPNKEIPEVGELVEIRYLYAYREGALYQPVYLGIRDDLTQEDDRYSLKYKPEESDE